MLTPLSLNALYRYHPGFSSNWMFFFLFFFMVCRIRKVWQKRKCGVKFGCLTISHSTVRTHRLNCHQSIQVRPEWIHIQYVCVCLQINRPPAKLNLLTCQVRPNPEDRRTFDLVTRRFTPDFWPFTLYPPSIISKDSIDSSAVQLFGSFQTH